MQMENKAYKFSLLKVKNKYKMNGCAGILAHPFLLVIYGIIGAMSREYRVPFPLAMYG